MTHVTNCDLCLNAVSNPLAVVANVMPCLSFNVSDDFDVGIVASNEFNITSTYVSINGVFSKAISLETMDETLVATLAFDNGVVILETFDMLLTYVIFSP